MRVKPFLSRSNEGIFVWRQRDKAKAAEEAFSKQENLIYFDQATVFSRYQIQLRSRQASYYWCPQGLQKSKSSALIPWGKESPASAFMYLLLLYSIFHASCSSCHHTFHISYGSSRGIQRIFFLRRRLLSKQRHTEASPSWIYVEAKELYLISHLSFLSLSRPHFSKQEKRRKVDSFIKGQVCSIYCNIAHT